MNNAAQPTYDIAIIGGGINGCGIAYAAAAAGKSVFLCDQGNLGGATSSASTKLIHGGLRYLETYEFGLVRKALQEREVLLKLAPEIIKPLTFVLPHVAGMRPKWLIRLGLFLYDYLAVTSLPKSRAVNLTEHAAGNDLKAEFNTAFTYSDCQVDDKALVLLNAKWAQESGAVIQPHTACRKAEVVNNAWQLRLSDNQIINAKQLINATGPWADKFLKSATTVQSDYHLRLVKGSHIVVKKLFDHDYAYILQQAYGRIVFAIPYKEEFTLIGTTEVEFNGDPADVKIDDQEIEYLLSAVNRYLKNPINKSHIVNTFSGVRPLLEDGSASSTKTTRDYKLEQINHHGAPLMNIWGGKITTYRALANEVINLIYPA